jgi:hypothetical protein
LDSFFVSVTAQIYLLPPIAWVAKKTTLSIAPRFLHRLAFLSFAENPRKIGAVAADGQEPQMKFLLLNIYSSFPI